MRELDILHLVIFLKWNITKVQYSQHFIFSHIHSLSMDPSTERTAITNGCPCTSILTHTTISTTNQVFKHYTQILCVPSIYIYPSANVWNNLTGPVSLLTVTSSGPYSIILWLQLLHNVIILLQFIFAILTQFFHLNCMEFIGLHNIQHY